MKRNADPRTHYYVSRCTQCPTWIVHSPNAPMRAEREARRHAKRRTGHEAYVIDLNALAVVYRRRFDALDESEDAPF